ncbi:TetR/AcrR family transcriptional regulator [uncultured Salinibacterium sp.]|uniref:TetR/AcrR family transcriptional regulator n=1 Tax=uncultured Salinibacterium sp. TaxID=459274 RepID=UPI0030DAD272
MSRSEAAYHHGNLVPAIERAALELMRSQGHASLSLREVARQAGVSHNAPYHHFGDRGALLKRLSERSMDELLGALQAAEQQAEESGIGAGSEHAYATAIGAAYVGYAADHPERFRLIYDPKVCIPGAPSAAMEPLLHSVEEILAAATAALIPGGEPAAVATLATGVWGAVHGLAELVVAGHISRAEVPPALEALLGVRGK